MEFKTQKQIKDAIKQSITTNEKAAIQAMLRIFEYQTAEEQANGTTYVYNGVGFAGNDAGILTSFCKQYQKKGYLSDKQHGLLFKKIGKYAGQLTKHAIERGLYVKKNDVWVVVQAKQNTGR